MTVAATDQIISEMDADQRGAAAVFATGASLILKESAVEVSDDQLSTRVPEALEARRIIAQAEGVVMERERILADDAYDRLLGFSRSTGRSLVDREADVVEFSHRPTAAPPRGAPVSTSKAPS
jgi:hypothetical protein